MNPSLILRESAERAVGLTRSRTLLGAGLLVTAGGAALTRLPLFEVPGYELSEALAIALAVVGGWAGIASARLERASAKSGGAVARSWGGAVLFGAGVLVLPLVAALAGAALGGRCSPFAGIGFFPLLPLPSLMVSAAAGLLAGFAARSALRAALLYGGALLASLALSLWPIWAGPQLFALDHFLGYFPGPLYDENLPVDGRLLAHRALTLLWTGAALAAAAAFLDPARLRLRPFAFTRRRLASTVALLALIAATRPFAFDLGLQTRSEDLAGALGGEARTEHFVIHYPASKSAVEVRRLERELEFHFDRVTRFLGAAPGERVHAYFHRGAAEKRRWVGAAQTDFAKPWRLEFHVVDEPVPHRSARHELAHVVAGAFGSPGLRVSARWLVGVNVGLVEGLAVAADDRSDELTVHQWAAAMRRLGLAPDLRGIVGPAGFYRQPASRAYSLSGSFLRFLADRHGSAPLRSLYPAGDFAASFGRPLDELATEWERFLDELPLDEGALQVARTRFERGSLFDRPCAREVASLLSEAAQARGADPERALRLYQRCEAIEPGNPAHLRAQAEIRRDREDREGAEALFARILDLSGASPGARAQALMELGDLAWERGDLPAARELFGAVAALRRDRASDRAAAIRLFALDDPEAGAVLRRFFARSADVPELVALKGFADARPDDAISRYLLGRQLLARGAPVDATLYLAEALGLGLEPVTVRVEGLRLLAQARYLAGEAEGAREALAELARQGNQADRGWAADWGARIEFEERAYGGLLRQGL